MHLVACTLWVQGDMLLLTPPTIELSTHIPFPLGWNVFPHTKDKIKISPVKLLLLVTLFQQLERNIYILICTYHSGEKEKASLMSE